ncbi:MAG TPA: hypothetical protein VFW89_00895 [Gemmatimonadaceae bacterium]|nr:hypothetical protein [Gemmatimonadaceae bacterium]
MRSLVCSLSLLAFAAGTTHAQGTLSTQGFGYPPGQIGARTFSMGGGPAEVDQLSLLNPASQANWGAPGLYLEYQPDYRSISSANGTDHTMTARFPQASGALTIGPRAVLGISTSTLLDRTWETQRTGIQHYATGDSAQFSEQFKSSGAIDDIQLALAFEVVRKLWIGVGGHLFTGTNDLSIQRTSSDTTFGLFQQSTSLTYSGSGVSGGLLWAPGAGLMVGVSGRVGGTMTSYRNDTSLTTGKVPRRLGAGVSFQGLPGVVVAFRGDWEGWSSLGSLGQPGLGVTDGWDIGGGVEVHGPGLFGSAMPLRAGIRERTLPFLADGTRIRERTYSVGTGIQILGGRSRIDLGLARANRTQVAGIAEHSTIFTVGFMVRP